MAKIILCRGIQGSGKTTWAKQWVLEDPEHRVRFNNDDIRNMLGKYWVPSREPIITTMKNSFISGAAIFRMDVVIDNMNLNSKELDYWKDMAKQIEDMGGLLIWPECLIMTLKSRTSLLLFKTV